jgi:hypothetical protein
MSKMFPPLNCSSRHNHSFWFIGFIKISTNKNNVLKGKILTNHDTRSQISARAIQITLVTVVTFTLSHTKIHFTLTLCTCYA